LAESREFFALPQEVKMKYQKKDAVTNFHGFTGPADEMYIAQKRKLRNNNFLTHLHFLNSLNENDKSAAEPKESFDFWGPEAFKKSSCPSEIPSLKESIDSYRESLAPLTRTILRALAFFLDLQDKDFFLKRHKAFLEDNSILSHNVVRTNFYLPNEETNEDEAIIENVMRCTEHQDWGTITFLYQDHVGGLEAKMTNGQWVPVNPVKDGIVLNAGLMLEMWSGGLFPATVT
jgi:isopenicillin N synthase-like dioxygenase